ncbi:4Fe-4S dicluster domain-containing protein [Egibacter rhizosphaerae]|uniref:4Fe-4S dicluster domain-containing protein n=1 Tax=Egibacter rhizosphaerae TaxID=1670831 RepID=A0A411YFB5_9ACTN|nr:Coenzyme F420 hydrogenase/dehydrogenase, beta subunit C-terminal domain [Egibacter rhizosphaerae]QBI19925.1 4Fe-4S dicluster domain-containing protein [Egibacter rhizosphaerae]
MSGAASSRLEQVRERYHQLLEEADDPNEWAYAWRSELNRGGFRAVDLLMDEVVHAGRCIGCAACVTVCPVDVFDYIDERPVDTRTGACVWCVLCTEVCPVLRPPDKDAPDLVDYRDDCVDEGYGPYSYALYTRATRPEILEGAQDGGLVSTLLIHGLERGAWQGAIVGDTLPENNQIGRHKLATTAEDVLTCSASRYTYSPNTLAFEEAMQRDVRPVAAVGVPCQIDGIRLQQNSSIRSAMSTWYRRNVALTIGLFCSEAFTHESIQRLGEMIEVEPERIDNINIKGKVVVRLDDGEKVVTSLKQYRQWARPACLYCLDYSGEQADIGAGGIGLDGWTYTLVRTEAGHRSLQAAIDDGWLETRPLEDEPRGEELLHKLSAEKKRNRPLPAKMPTLAEREELGWVDPKTFYTKGPGAPAEADAGSAGESG